MNSYSQQLSEILSKLVTEWDMELVPSIAGIRHEYVKCSTIRQGHVKLTIRRPWNQRFRTRKRAVWMVREVIDKYGPLGIRVDIDLK